LANLEGFARHVGPDRAGLPRTTDCITLERQGHTVPDEIACGFETLVPFYAGQTLGWRLR